MDILFSDHFFFYDAWLPRRHITNTKISAHNIQTKRCTSIPNLRFKIIHNPTNLIWFYLRWNNSVSKIWFNFWNLILKCIDRSSDKRICLLGLSQTKSQSAMPDSASAKLQNDFIDSPFTILPNRNVSNTSQRFCFRNFQSASRLQHHVKINNLNRRVWMSIT